MANDIKSTDRFFVFDVEAIGLRGEGFAFGYVIIENKKEVERGALFFARAGAVGSATGRAWVNKHVPPRFPNSRQFESGSALRVECWRLIKEEAAKGAKFFAEGGFPVEANFLLACAATMDSEETIPYPLYDVMTVVAAAGLDPMAKRERLYAEEPEHNPEADARQSARLLLEALERLETFAEVAAQVLGETSGPTIPS